MSIRKISTKNGEAKWEVRVHENGRSSRRIRRRFDRKVDAEIFVKEFNEKTKKEREMLSSNGMRPLAERTFAEEVEYWLDSARLRYSPGHIKRMTGVLKEMLYKYSDLTLDRITPEFITKIQHEQKTKGLENSTINRKIQIFTTILNHSCRHRRIPMNPCQFSVKLTESYAEMSFWSEKEAQSFLAFANERYPLYSAERWKYVAYLTALNTGIRAGELWGLRSVDLSEDGYKITIRRQYNRVTRGFTLTKGKKPRVVPCNLELRTELLNLISSLKIQKEETIFMNEVRGPINHDNFAKRDFVKDVTEWSKKDQGKIIRFHDLRHTATTLMIAAGVDIKTVKEICGHADISTTMNYIHLVAGSIEKVAQSFSISAFKNPEGEGVVA